MGNPIVIDSDSKFATDLVHACIQARRGDLLHKFFESGTKVTTYHIIGAIYSHVRCAKQWERDLSIVVLDIIKEHVHNRPDRDRLLNYAFRSSAAELNATTDIIDYTKKKHEEALATLGADSATIARMVSFVDQHNDQPPRGEGRKSVNNKACDCE